MRLPAPGPFVGPGDFFFVGFLAHREPTFVRCEAMAARSVGTASISFGLVSIPVNIFTATSPQKVSFNMLHKGCGSRVQQRMFCPVDNVTVEPADIMRGFEHAKDQYVSFTEEELKQLALENTNTIELVEFVPASSVDLLYVESSNYLAPGKGGDRAYQLLAKALIRQKKIAIGRFNARGKGHVVAIRPFQRGLVLHRLFFKEEVRSFEDAIDAATFELEPIEITTAYALMDAMSSDAFDPKKYADEYRVQVRRAVDEKIAGQEVTATPVAPKAQIIDLLEALKRSVALAGSGAANESQRPPAADKKSEPPPSAKPGPAKAKAVAKKRAKKTSAG